MEKDSKDMASAALNDRLRDRFQIQFQINWQLMPDRADTWLRWAFSPHVGVTRMGQKFPPFTGGRRFLPDGPTLSTLVDTVDDGNGIDPATGLKNWWFESRVFWLRAALRILGLDVGFGVYLRKRYQPESPVAESDAPKHCAPEKTPPPEEQS